MFAKNNQMAAAIAISALLLSTTAGVASAQMTQIAQIAQMSSTNAKTNRETVQVSSLPVAARTTVDYQTLYVDPMRGDDSAGGVEAQPLQTVTRALELAAPNTVIVLAPGRYSQASGEVFPLQLKSGVTIQGMSGARDRTAIIEGGGNFESPSQSQQNAAIIAADRAGIAQIAVSNPFGYGVWVESASPTIIETAFVGNRQTGIYVAGGSPRVRNSYFSDNQVAGLIVFGVSSASIQGNTFERTGDAIRVVNGATPEIVSNRMTDNNAGLVVIGNARPVLRDNQIVGNRQNEIIEVAESSFSTALEEGTVRLSIGGPSFGGSSVESDAATQDTLEPGAPGSALSALRAGIASTVALVPRAVSGENPDSPLIRRRRNTRDEPEPARNISPADEAPLQPVLPPINNNRLAVPSSSIPLGSGSSAAFSAPRAGAGAAPAPTSRAQALGLYYRVFVEASDPFMQDEVRTVVPDAFRTQFEGRTMMQVGAFPTEDEANDRRRLLEDNNLDARVEYIR